jgi:hypothetical protein
MNWKPAMSAVAWLKLPEAKKIGKRQAFLAQGKRGEYHVEPVVSAGKVKWTSTCRQSGATTSDDVGERHYASSVSAIRAAESYDKK